MLNRKSLFVLLLTLIFATPDVLAQRAQSKKNVAKSTASTSVSNNSKTGDKPTAAFEALRNSVNAFERIDKLNQFIVDFPRSELKIKAVEMLVVSHIEVGEASFQSNDKTSGAEHFQRAALTFEPAVSDGIFNDFIVKLPFNLFLRGEQVAALEVAREIEPKVKDNAARLLALANFYLSTENADDAKRLATRAAEIAPDSAAAQMSLGMAQRIAFHLEAASQAYARAVELAPTLAIAKRNLADALRGLGQSEDALKLYRELLATNAADEAARNGLILTLFNAGNQDEAEKELAAALQQNPKNLVLQTGAAYWYAANGMGARAVELAQKTVETEPRYVWGQIALARGLILEKRPLEAEHALLIAKQYGNFPTLDYELASAHFAAGLYSEAADDLHRSFALKNGKITTKLAGRSASEADNFIELLSRERRASIFEPTSASNAVEAGKLKELLVLTVSDAPDNSDKNFDENALVKAAQDFAAGEDEMRVYRELYAANKLLFRKVAAEQILELTQSATSGLEKSLDVPAATAAILADELYEPRRLAATSGNMVNIPVLPRETLRQIMRGRVEEIAGSTLYQENKLEEAAVRLRRAVGVLPENSVWWRSSYWKLGAALDASGKSREALAAYLKSYQADVPNETRLIIIQALYQRVYGSLNGLAERLSRTEKITSTASFGQITPQQRTTPLATNAVAFKNPLPNVIAEINSAKPIEPPKSDEPNLTQTKPLPTSEAVAETAPPVISAPPAAEVKDETVAATQTQIAETTLTEKETLVEIAAPTPKVEPVPQPSPAIETAEKPELETKAPAKNEDQVAQGATIKIENTAEEKLPEELASKSEDKLADKTETVAAPIIEPVLVEIKLPPPLEPIVESATAKENTLIEKAVDEKKTVASDDSVLSKEAEADSVLNRPRVIIQPINPPTPAINQVENEPKSVSANCFMQPSQSEFSVLRNGGTVAFIVAFSDAAAAAKLKVSVSSPTDLNVILLAPDDVKGDHRLVQVSSISEITKVYTIVLDSPCGKQEIKVRVR